MKLSIHAGTTSETCDIFVQDSSKTDGSGLIGLVYNAVGLTCYYNFPRQASTAVTLATLASATAAWSSGGFKEIDATNQPGKYRFDIPNALLAAGNGRYVSIYLKGAAFMVPVPIEIELTGWDNQDANRGGLTALGVYSGVLPSQTGSTTTTVLTGVSGLAGATLVGNKIAIVSGTGIGQARVITAWSTGGTATINYAWTTQPAIGDGYVIYNDNAPKVDVNLQTQANVVQWLGTPPQTPNTAGVPIVDDRTVIRVNTAGGSAGSTTIQLDAGASSVNNFYKGLAVIILSGTGAGQGGRVITNYVGATKIATVTPAWITTVDNTSVFVLVSAGVDVEAINSFTTTASGAITVSTNIGSSQPINFSGSGASAYVKVDLQTILGTPSPAAPGYVAIDLNTVNNQNASLNLSNTVIGLATSTGTVSGNVSGSLLGDVIGRVVGNSATSFNNVGVFTGDTVRVNTAQAGSTASTLVLDAGANGAINDYYKNTVATIISGTGAGQTGRLVTGYTASSKTCAVSPNWLVTPDNTSKYALMNGTTSSSGGGDPWSITLPGAYPIGTAGYIVGTFLDTNVGSRMATFTLPAHFSSMAISVAGGVTLADGVAHGGTLGSSTATFAMSAVEFKSQTNGVPALFIQAPAANADAVKIQNNSVGFGCIVCLGQNGASAFIIGGPSACIDAQGGGSIPALLLRGPYVTPGPAVLIDNTTAGGYAGGPAVVIQTTLGHGISITGSGSNQHDIALLGSHDILGNLNGSVSGSLGGSVSGDVNGRVVGGGATPFLGVGAQVALTYNGLDNVVLETGINARQGLSLILAGSSCGNLAGAPNGPIIIYAAGNPGTVRITGTVDGAGNRTSIVLNPPP
jgi:hypothetical protein